MKTTIKLAAALLATTVASSAYANTITGHASATVVGAVNIVEQQQISFGSFGSGSTLGKVATQGTSDGGVTLLVPGQPGIYKVTGPANSPFNLTAPNQITLTNGSSNMNADVDFLTGPGGANTLDSTGQKTFNVNGILVVPANTPSGLYTSSFPVTVNY